LEKIEIYSYIFEILCRFVVVLCIFSDKNALQFYTMEPRFVIARSTRSVRRGNLVVDVQVKDCGSGPQWRLRDRKSMAKSEPAVWVVAVEGVEVFSEH